MHIHFQRMDKSQLFGTNKKQKWFLVAGMKRAHTMNWNSFKRTYQDCRSQVQIILQLNLMKSLTSLSGDRFTESSYQKKNSSDALQDVLWRSFMTLTGKQRFHVLMAQINTHQSNVGNMSPKLWRALSAFEKTKAWKFLLYNNFLGTSSIIIIVISFTI